MTAIPQNPSDPPPSRDDPLYRPIGAVRREADDLNSPPAVYPPAPDIETQMAREPSRARRYLKLLGPGITSGAANEDPSAIATYAQAGASLGFGTLWLVPVLFPMMAVAVYLSAKLSMVTGRGLAGILRTHFPRPVLYSVVLALLVANTFNAGADLGAIAAGISLLIPGLKPIWVLVPVTLVLVALQVWTSYRTMVALFKWLTLLLFAFIAAGILAKPDVLEVLRATLLPRPSFDRPFLLAAVAFVGTALSPYLYFWQTSQRVEEEITMGRRRLWQRRGASDTELQYATKDVSIGMLFATLIIYFIILATAGTLFKNGQHDVGTAADAAKALEPVAGPAAKYLFALGFIGAGLLAIPVLTAGASYAVAEALEWRHGLDQRPGDAPGFYVCIAASTLAGMCLNFLPLDPMKALVIAATINGLLSPPLLLLVMLASRHPKIMPLHPNRPWVTALGWLTTAATFAAAGGLLLTWLM